MPVFRVSQSGRVVAIEAPTVMEATARAVVMRGFHRDSSLAVEPLPPGAALQETRTPLPDLTRAAARELERVQQLPPVQHVVGREATARTAAVVQLMVAFAALSALLVAVLIGGGWVIVARAAHPGPLGDCLRIGLCTATPLSTVEARTGITLPQGTERLRSSASRNGRFVSALVRLPAGADRPSAPKGSIPALTGRATDALQSTGATNLSGWEDGAVGLFVGQANDRIVVFLRYEDSTPPTESAPPAAAPQALIDGYPQLHPVGSGA